MNKYELTEEEINEMYSALFTKKEQFVHKSDPDNQTELEHIEDCLDVDDTYIIALILFRDCYATYEEAINGVIDYRVYTSIEEREKDYYSILEDMTDSFVDDALTDGNKSWLKHHIDMDAVIDDLSYDRTYTEVLSPYEEEIEDTVNDV
ncbi:MAG TPA: hypothetical protein ENK75_05875, partial [Saprospiraceae bacterium]|nr:hypothetical protein [Saprospiraceae bacterium]